MACWSLTYMLFKTQTILLSALCRKGLLYPNLQPVQNPDHFIVSIMQKWPPGPWLTACSKFRAAHCQHHAEMACCILTYTLFIVKSSPLSTSCRNGLLHPDLHPVPNPEHSIVSQHHAEMISWTQTYMLFKIQAILLLVSCRNMSWTLTYILFTTQTTLLSVSCRNGYWNMTYMLFRAQTILLSVSCRNGLLKPDLHAVQNPDHSIVSIM